MNDCLIEKVARAIFDVANEHAASKFEMMRDDEAANLARAAIAAIEASGTHVVMPAYSTAEMHDAAMPTRLHPNDPSMDEFRMWSGDAGNFQALYRRILSSRPRVTEQ